MVRSLKMFVSCIVMLFITNLRAAEPWALWSNFLDLADSTTPKAPDVSSTQNEINGSGFTFNKGSGVVNSDGYMSTVGGEGEAPYIDFNKVMNIGYNSNPFTVVTTLKMPASLPDGNTLVKPLFHAAKVGNSGIGLTVKSIDNDNDITFGGSWGSTIDWSGSYSDRCIQTEVQSGQIVTLITEFGSSGVVIKKLNEGIMGQISGLKGSSIEATRITFGNGHNSGENTMAFEIVSVAVFRGDNISDADIIKYFSSGLPTLDAGIEGEASSVKWCDGAWNTEVPKEGAVAINIKGDVTLTVDSSVALSVIRIKGTGSLTLRTVNNESFNVDFIISDIPIAVGDSGVNIASSSSEITYLYKTDTLKTSQSGNVYTKGAGSVSGGVTNSIAINHNGGYAVLRGTEGSEPFYISQSENGTMSTVVFTNATVVYPALMSLGHANYTVAGTSDVSCFTNVDNQGFYLSNGNPNRSSTFVLKDSASLKVFGVNNVDSNRGAILFGHWNGPSNFTLQDSAQFIAQGEVLVGKTGNNHVININGGKFSAQGIKTSASASGENTLNLSGGVLALGDIGLTTYNASRKMTINVSNMPIICAKSAQLPITHPINLNEDATLSFTKEEGLAMVDVSLTGGMTGNGAINVASGVNLNLYTSRPKLGTVSGKILLTATPKEMGNGLIKFAISQDAYSNEIFSMVVDPQGNQIAINSISVVDSFVTLEIETNVYSQNTATSTWNEAAEGIVVIKGGETESVTLTVDEPFPVGVSEIDVVGNVEVEASVLESYGSETVLNIAEGAVVTVKGAWPFARVIGSGTLILDFEGTSATITGDNTAFVGSCVVASGTVKMGHYKCFGQWPRTILVKSGAILDANGVGNAGNTATSYTLQLEEGAKYCNTAQPNGDRKLAFAVSGLVLDGNATMDASQQLNGLTRHYNYPSQINLNEYDLTLTGGQGFYLTCPEISGTGTFKISSGTTVQMVRSNSGAHPFCEGVLDVAESSELKILYYNGGVSKLTVNTLVVNGQITRDNPQYAENGTCTVTNSLSGTGRIAVPVVMGQNARLKIGTTGCLTFEAGVSGNIVLDMSGVDLNKARKLKVMRVTDAALLPQPESIAGVPRGWTVSKTDDGLGLYVSRPMFYIIVR